MQARLYLSKFVAMILTVAMFYACTSYNKNLFLNKQAIKSCLALKDLSNPKHGIHAINLLIQRIKDNFENTTGFPKVSIRRSSKLSHISKEFDQLFIPYDHKQRSPSHVKYINETTLLRSHVTPIVPKVLREICEKNTDNYMLFAPGICFNHCFVNKKKGLAPHKMDIWRIQRREVSLQRDDLLRHIEIVLQAISASLHYKILDTSHPYTANGIAVEAELMPNEWVKILEGGEAASYLLHDAGLNPKEYSGIAIGLGLDRLVMALKGIDDIRLLRSQNPVIAEQMQHLRPFQKIGKFTEIEKIFSVIVPNKVVDGHLCSFLQEALGPKMDYIASICIINTMDSVKTVDKEDILRKANQKEIIFKAIFNAVDRNLTLEEVNLLSNRIYHYFNKLT